MSDLNKSVALSYVDVWNSSDFDALDGIIIPTIARDVAIVLWHLGLQH
jgi:hypothetical protein